MAGGSAPGASLVDRTLDVLGAFDERHRRLTLTRLAARSGLTPPTTLRIVRRLLAAGALERTGLTFPSLREAVEPDELRPAGPVLVTDAERVAW